MLVPKRKHLSLHPLSLLLVAFSFFLISFAAPIQSAPETQLLDKRATPLTALNVVKYLHQGPAKYGFIPPGKNHIIIDRQDSGASARIATDGNDDLTSPETIPKLPGFFEEFGVSPLHARQPDQLEAIMLGATHYADQLLVAGPLEQGQAAGMSHR